MADHQMGTLLQRAMATVEHDLRILRHDVGRGQDSKAGSKALAKRIGQLEAALGQLRWDHQQQQQQQQLGVQAVRRERHRAGWWCWHVVLQAGTLLLGLESLVCRQAAPRMTKKPRGR